MLIYLLMMVAAESVPVVKPNPDILVEGEKTKSEKLVCTGTSMTGSRVKRSRYCRTKAVADAEAAEARELMRLDMQNLRYQQSIRCSAGPARRPQDGPGGDPMCH